MALDRPGPGAVQFGRHETLLMTGAARPFGLIVAYPYRQVRCRVDPDDAVAGQQVPAPPVPASLAS
jgi:hypothetical protein